MDGFTLSLAYKYVALVLMLGEVNFFSAGTGLKFDHPVTETDVRAGSHVGPPKTNDFTGSILTDKYFFGFGWGHLANFHRNDFRSDSDTQVRERNERLAKQSSLIDTNGALELATGWLSAMGVDLPLLQQKYKLNVVQWRYRGDGLTQGPVMLPVYQVEWRGSPFPTKRTKRETAVVTLTILGTTKELIEYHLLDDSLFARPAIRIPEPQRLLSLPDSEFQQYNAQQRSNLLAQVTAAVPSASPVPSAQK
jgi:hypothetical protein